MITVKNILDFMETIAPQEMKLDGDNVGLLCGGKDRSVTKVLVALDPFEHVCKEAADWGAELIVTHHPLIFIAPREVTDETWIGRSIQQLCAKGISAINAHTNLDCAPNGVNDQLARVLGLENVEVIGRENVIRTGKTAATLPEFLEKVKKTLGCQGLRYVDGGKPVSKVAVGGGSCASLLMEVADAGCDTFVTADVKYNQFWDAQELGINLIDAGHFQTENPIVPVLAEKIRAAFPEIQVKVAESHTDCMKFY